MDKRKIRKYKENTRLGPYNTLFKKYTYKDKNRHWYGIFECPYCKKDYETSLTSVIQGQSKSCGCHQHAFKYKKGDLIGPYFIKLVSDCWVKNGHTYGKFECPKCGDAFTTRPIDVVSGRRKCCPKHRMENLFGGVNNNPLIDLSGQRFGKLTAIKPIKDENGWYLQWLCKCDCGKEKIVRTQNLKKGCTTSCGCIKSANEIKIEEILTELQIDFETEKTFDNCINPKTNYKLRFDFYLPDYNTCIEYDGQQHYIGWWQDKIEGSLESSQYRDKIKTDFCRNNNIKLIRIPYWDENKIDKQYILNKIK